MSGRTRVSVAMTTYNGARFLPAQLDSIAGQSRPPDELVVGDDGSTDATEEVFAEFARRVPFEVRFTRNPERLGSSQNFVAALRRCTGDVVLLSDQDDAWLPARVERSLQVLEAHPEAAFAFSDGELMDERGAPLPGRLWERAFFGPDGQRAFREHRGPEVLLRTNVVTGATMAIRRDRIASALPIPRGWVHDGWLAFLLELQFGAVPIAEPLIRYRLHAAQQIGVLRTTPGAILALLRRQDAAFYRGQATNHRALAERVGALGCPGAAEAARRALEKSRCLEDRAAFRDDPLRGVAGFAGAVLRGDYGRYGLGLKQAAFDLVGAIATLFGRPAGAGR